MLIALLTLFAPARSVMTQSSLTFTQTKLLASDAAQYDYFGLSVAVKGDTAVIGAYGKSDLARNAGAAYAFARNAGAWGAAGAPGNIDPSDRRIPWRNCGYQRVVHGGRRAVCQRWRAE
jgi:hypothetical protein